MNGAILGMRKAEIDRKFDEIVAFSEIEQFLDTPVKRYSSGMYVRLAFAVAAHLEPEILIVDEVLAVGDFAFQKKCLGKMQDVAAGDGRTILFVSHNMGALSQLCDRGILLEKGTVTAIGPIQEVIEDVSRGRSRRQAAQARLPHRAGPSPASGSRRRCSTTTAARDRSSVATSRSRSGSKLEDPAARPELMLVDFTLSTPWRGSGSCSPTSATAIRRSSSGWGGPAHLRDQDPAPAAGVEDHTRSPSARTGSSRRLDPSNPYHDARPGMLRVQRSRDLS